MKRKFVWILMAIALGFSSGVAMAQSTLGTILGTVTDQSGAVVPNATVKITNLDENTSRTLTTNASGNYEAVDIKAGHYSVEVTNAGFKTTRVGGVELTARQTLRVDVALTVGVITQQMEVKGESVGVITTETQTVSSAYNTLEITSLPTNYRASGNGNSPYYLLEILPGTQTDQSGNISIQGALVSQSQFSVDGISITNAGGNSPLTNAFPSAESLAEMKVQGVGSPAEFQNPGDVTTTTKSGSNTVHGSTFWYHQNAALNALPFGSKTKPAEIANDFGGSVGGPVVIPHLYNGRNKSFFYGDYEGFRLPRTSAIQNTVPTAAMRTGDLGYLCTQPGGTFSAGVCSIAADQLYSPYTGAPYANDVITGINSASTAFLGLYPLPNYGSTFTSANYRTNLPANLTSNAFDVRGDQYFGSKLSVSGRYTYKNIPSLSPNELTIPSSTTFEHVRMLVASGTYTFRPTLLNEARFGMTVDNSGKANPYPGMAFTQALNFEGINNLWWNGLPQVSFAGITSSLNVDRMNSTSTSHTYEFADNLSWVKGRHTFKFGMTFEKMSAISALGFFGSDNYGGYTFDPLFTGNDFGDFLIGAPYESDQDNVELDNNGQNHRLGLFAEDSFRVTRRLTVEYGIRWEDHPGYTDASGQIGNFNEDIPLSGAVVYPDGAAKLLAPTFLESFDACPLAAVPATANDPLTQNGAPCTPVQTASQAGLNEGLRNTSKRFMPRFGFAYKLTDDGKTVVRGGLGAYQASTMGSVYYSLTGTLQAQTNTYFNFLQTTASGSTPNFVWPATMGSEVKGVPGYGTAYFGTANTINWKEPYSVQWNLSLERDLGFATGLRLSYIGMRTTNLVWAPNYNQSLPSTTPYSLQPLSSRPFPNWQRVYVRATGATAESNQFQAEVTHRVGGGVTVDSTYTWARSLADNQGPSEGSLCGETACNRTGAYYDRRSEKGNTFAPYTHNWIATVVYQFPVGRGRRFGNTDNKILNGVIGGWQTNNVFRLHSGPWLSPTFGTGDPSGTGAGPDGLAQHPDRVGPANPTQKNSSQWFLASGFACPTPSAEPLPITSCTKAGTSAANPPIGRFGTAGVGILRGPGTLDWDAGISKGFHLTERARLRFEFSFVNVMNHLNLGNPSMTVTSANNPATGQCGFGCITSAQGLFSFAGARQGQVTARIDF